MKNIIYVQVINIRLFSINYIMLLHLQIQYTLHNQNNPSPVLGVVQISESFGLVNVYIFNGAYSLHYFIMHHKILSKYGVQICEGSDLKGSISDSLLYSKTHIQYFRKGKCPVYHTKLQTSVI